MRRRLALRCARERDPPQVDAAPLRRWQKSHAAQFAPFSRSQRARGGGGGAARARRRREREGIYERVRRPVAFSGQRSACAAPAVADRGRDRCSAHLRTRAHKHTHTHTRTAPHTFTHMHTHTHSRAHTCTTQAHKCTCRTRTHTHAHTGGYKQAHTDSHAHPHPHAPTRTHAHAQTHTHARADDSRCGVCGLSSGARVCAAGRRRCIWLLRKASTPWCGCCSPTARTSTRWTTTGPPSTHAAGVPFDSYFFRRTAGGGARSDPLIIGGLF
jgi:hypothetical protein